jgi:hypothetical protein
MPVTRFCVAMVTRQVIILNYDQWTRLHVRIVHPKWPCDQPNRAWRWRTCSVNCGRFMGRRARIPWWWRRLITVRVLISSCLTIKTRNVTDRPRAGRPRKTTTRVDWLISIRARQQPFSTPGRTCSVNCGRFMGRRARIPWWWRRLITVRVLMWPPNAKLPRSAPGVLNGCPW